MVRGLVERRHLSTGHGESKELRKRCAVNLTVSFNSGPDDPSALTLLLIFSCDWKGALRTLTLFHPSTDEQRVLNFAFPFAPIREFTLVPKQFGLAITKAITPYSSVNREEGEEKISFDVLFLEKESGLYTRKLISLSCKSSPGTHKRSLSKLFIVDEKSVVLTNIERVLITRGAK